MTSRWAQGFAITTTLAHLRRPWYSDARIRSKMNYLAEGPASANKSTLAKEWLRDIMQARPYEQVTNFTDEEKRGQPLIYATMALRGFSESVLTGTFVDVKADKDDVDTTKRFVPPRLRVADILLIEDLRADIGKDDYSTLLTKVMEDSEISRQFKLNQGADPEDVERYGVYYNPTTLDITYTISAPVIACATPINDETRRRLGMDGFMSRFVSDTIEDDDDLWRECQANKLGLRMDEVEYRAKDLVLTNQLKAYYEIMCKVEWGIVPAPSMRIIDKYRRPMLEETFLKITNGTVKESFSKVYSNRDDVDLFHHVTAVAMSRIALANADAILEGKTTKFDIEYEDSDYERAAQMWERRLRFKIQYYEGIAVPDGSEMPNKKHKKILMALAKLSPMTPYKPEEIITHLKEFYSTDSSNARKTFEKAISSGYLLNGSPKGYSLTEKGAKHAAIVAKWK